jgi:hypothetical protein
MSPEQARGREVDHRADLFTLGVLAYRVLTGRPAFGGREVPQILYSVVHRMPPRPSDLVKVPAVVDDVLAIAMAKRPSDRFDSAAEMVAALEAALAGTITPALQGRAERLHVKRSWSRSDVDAEDGSRGGNGNAGDRSAGEPSAGEHSVGPDSAERVDLVLTESSEGGRRVVDS